VNRQEIIDQIAQADQIPATGMSPKGISGFDTINPNSPWTPAAGDLDQAKDELSQAANPKTDINLFFNDAPATRRSPLPCRRSGRSSGSTAR
jgi:ABC-type transport system substrate-binding protein